MSRLLLGLLVVTGLAQCAVDDRVRYLLPADTFPQPSVAEQAAVTAAICDGKADGNHCDTCPESSQEDVVGFELSKVVLGHFLEPNTTDALVTVSGCEQMHASIGWGFLVTRREGKWESLEDMLGLELSKCHRMKFRSGRELLVCEDYRMAQFELTHSVSAIFAEGEKIGFRNLLTANDTTGNCYDQTRPQLARIDKIEFRDLNADGIEDVAFTASFGTLPDSPRRQDLCQQAQDEKPGVRRPGPKVLKAYRIEYLFDGEHFTLTKPSQAAAELFHWEN